MSTDISQLTFGQLGVTQLAANDELQGEIDPADLGMDGDIPEPEVFSLTALRELAKQPRFKVGDAVWVSAEGLEADEEDEDVVDGYLAVTIVGVEVDPHDTIYLVGHWDPDTNEVTTIYEAFASHEVFAEIPQVQKVRKGPALSVVK